MRDRSIQLVFSASFQAVGKIDKQIWNMANAREFVHVMNNLLDEVQPKVW